ncbi:MAG: hypothetical protein E6K70_12705 [Planctomycetota bacterium]|nr:MAG: hypothetical protein E6K70_12705 [Planctomycetota bacterium]
MADPNDYSEALTVLPAWPLDAVPAVPERRKGQPVIAWIVIFLCCAFILATHYLPDLKNKNLQEGGPTSTVVELQARYLVGAGELLNARPAMYAQAKALDTGPVEQRLRFIVVAGELVGPDEALQRIKGLRQRLRDNGVELTPKQDELLQALDGLYQDYAHKKFDGPSLTAKERALLRDELGWWGELALTPAGGSDKEARGAVLWPAYRTVFVVLGLFLGVGLIGFLGLVLLIIFLVFLFGGKLHLGVQCGSAHGGVYAETFALWMVLFLLINYGVGWFVARWFPLGQWRYLASGVLELFSLAALGWPVLRGIPWRQVRSEVGLTAGRKPALEPVIGLAGNAMSIPLLGAGLILTMILMAVQAHLQRTGDPGNEFSPQDLPSHPIIHEIATSGWFERLQLLFLASGVAPIVEETMFRGVLYRHLREGTCKAPYFVSSTRKVSWPCRRSWPWPSPST